MNAPPGQGATIVTGFPAAGFHGLPEVPGLRVIGILADHGFKLRPGVGPAALIQIDPRQHQACLPMAGHQINGLEQHPLGQVVAAIGLGNQPPTEIVVRIPGIQGHGLFESGLWRRRYR